MRKSAVGDRRNFTLVEILTVVAIIAVLAGITLGTYGFVKNKMAVSRTETTIKKLETALKSMQSKFGFVPQGEGCLVIARKPSGSFVLQDIDRLALPDPAELKSGDVEINFGRPGKVGSNPKRPYPMAYVTAFVETIGLEELKKECIICDGDIVIMDAWEQPLLYWGPGLNNTGTFDLASAGMDGKLGEGDKTIWNAAKTKLGSDAEMSEVAPTDSDDIANF